MRIILRFICSQLGEVSYQSLCEILESGKSGKTGKTKQVTIFRAIVTYWIVNRCGLNNWDYRDKKEKERGNKEKEEKKQK